MEAPRIMIPKPRAGYLVCLPYTLDYVSPNGILLPPNGDKQETCAKVYDVPEGETEFKVGDIIVYSRHGITTIESIAGKKMLIINQTAVIGWLRDVKEGELDDNATR